MAGAGVKLERGAKPLVAVTTVGITTRGAMKAVEITNSLDQQTLVGLTGYDRGPGIAALEHGGTRIEPQAPALRRGVAGVAVLDEKRPDTGFEVVAPVGGRS